MGFINPTAFLLSVFVIGLVLLYLWERNQRRFDVPSLLLWEAVPESVVRRSRFQPDPLFWLQLAVLATLIVGLADPYWTGSADDGPGERAVLVLDLSASMQARAGDASRLELARRAAIQVVETAAPGTEFMLVVAAREPRTAAGFTVDRRDLVDKLGRLTAMDTTAQLEPALAIARRAAANPRVATAIHVFTDLPREWIDERWTPGIHWWPVGATDDNLAIASIEVNQGVLQGHDKATAQVAVRNFSRDEKHGSLALEIDGRVFERRLFTLQGNDNAYFSFDHIPAPGVLAATLADHDALALDNRAFAWVRPSRPVRLAIVADPAPFTEQLHRIAAATEAIDLVSVTTNAPENWDGIDVALFHRQVPITAPDVPSLVIAPPRRDQSGRQGGNNGDGGPRPATSAAQIVVLDWNEAHPTLRGIDPRLFRPFTSIAEITPPAWSEPILTTQWQGRELAILLAGELDKKRRAILTVDLEDASLLSTDHETTLLLLLNLLDWLARGSEGVRIAETGSSIQLDSDERQAPAVTDPRGRSAELATGKSPVVQLDLAGLYEVDASGGITTIAANFNSPRESNIGRPAPHPSRPSEERTAGQRGAPAHGFESWLYWLAAAFLTLEWFVAGRSH